MITKYLYSALSGSVIICCDIPAYSRYVLISAVGRFSADNTVLQVMNVAAVFLSLLCLSIANDIEP